MSAPKESLDRRRLVAIVVVTVSVVAVVALLVWAGTNLVGDSSPGHFTSVPPSG